MIGRRQSKDKPIFDHQNRCDMLPVLGSRRKRLRSWFSAGFCAIIRIRLLWRGNLCLDELLARIPSTFLRLAVLMQAAEAITPRYIEDVGTPLVCKARGNALFFRGSIAKRGEFE